MVPFVGAVLLSGRSHRVLSIRARHAAAGAERRLRRAVELRGGPDAAARHGGAGPEPGHPHRPGRQLQVQPALPHAGHRLPRGQDRVVPALQRRGRISPTRPTWFIRNPAELFVMFCPPAQLVAVLPDVDLRARVTRKPTSSCSIAEQVGW